MDIVNMIKQINEIQGKVKDTQKELAKITVSAESGAGLVKAVVNGNKEVIKVEIDPSIFKQEEKEMVEDLLVAAINKAFKEADIKNKEEMQKATEGMIPNIPGFDFGFGS